MLKKLFVLPLALMLLLCGCSQKGKVEPILSKLSFTADIEYNGENFIFDATLSDNALSLVTVEPIEIKGFTLTLDKNASKANFEDVTYTFNGDNGLLSILFDIIGDVKNKKTLKEDSDNLKVSGKVGECKYTFTFSPGGLPISLAAKSPNLNVFFKNVTIMS